MTTLYGRTPSNRQLHIVRGETKPSFTRHGKFIALRPSLCGTMVAVSKSYKPDVTRTDDPVCKKCLSKAEREA